MFFHKFWYLNTWHMFPVSPITKEEGIWSAETTTATTVTDL